MEPGSGSTGSGYASATSGCNGLASVPKDDASDRTLRKQRSVMICEGGEGEGGEEGDENKKDEEKGEGEEGKVRDIIEKNRGRRKHASSTSSASSSSSSSLSQSGSSSAVVRVGENLDLNVLFIWVKLIWNARNPTFFVCA